MRDEEERNHGFFVWVSFFFCLLNLFACLCGKYTMARKLAENMAKKALLVCKNQMDWGCALLSWMQGSRLVSWREETFLTAALHTRRPRRQRRQSR